MPQRLPILRVNKWPRRALQLLLQLLIIFFPFLIGNWWGPDVPVCGGSAGPAFTLVVVTFGLLISLAYAPMGTLR